eukprot:360617-Chlamydomonas_euryale.AAC.2
MQRIGSCAAAGSRSERMCFGRPEAFKALGWPTGFEALGLPEAFKALGWREAYVEGLDGKRPSQRLDGERPPPPAIASQVTYTSLSFQAMLGSIAGWFGFLSDGFGFVTIVFILQKLFLQLWPHPWRNWPNRVPDADVAAATPWQG